MKITSESFLNVDLKGFLFGIIFGISVFFAFGSKANDDNDKVFTISSGTSGNAFIMNIKTGETWIRDAQEIIYLGTPHNPTYKKKFLDTQSW